MSGGRRCSASVIAGALCTVALGLTFAPRSSADVVGDQATVTVGTSTLPSVSTPIPDRVDVMLLLAEQSRATRTYVASVTSKGQPVAGAKLDISALSDDPDLRVPTTPFASIPGEPGRYSARIEFPSNGTWVLTVRGSGSIDQVDMFTAKITTAGDRVHVLTPSRRSLAAIDPTFGARYDPTRLSPGSPLSASEVATAQAASVGHGGTTVVDHSVIAGGGFEPMTLLWAFLHVAGIVAWLSAVLGLVLANRVGVGRSRTRLVQFVTERYVLLAGGGLLTVLVSGVTLAHGTPLVTSDGAPIAATGLGLAYLLVFSVKMTLVAAAAVTTVRIGLLLRALPAPVWTVRSLGAAADEQRPARVFRLAETNAALVVAILTCVVLLNNLHHAIH